SDAGRQSRRARSIHRVPGARTGCPRPAEATRHRRVRYRQALLLLLALVVTWTVHAETQYVIEQLVVNVNSAPDASGQRVATIKSGDAVEVLDKQGDQIHVHLANGTQG